MNIYQKKFFHQLFLLKNKNATSCLVSEIKKDNDDLIRQYIAGGFDINRTLPGLQPFDRKNLTPLHWACIQNAGKCIDVLLENKVNIDALDSKNTTPLNYLCSSSYNGIIVPTDYRFDAEERQLLLRVKKMVAAGANIHHNQYQSPLFQSVLRHQDYIALYLISIGADGLEDGEDSSFSKSIRFKNYRISKGIIGSIDTEEKINRAFSIDSLYGSPLKEDIKAAQLKLTLETTLEEKPRHIKKIKI